MSFEFIKKLPTPEEIRNQYPLDAELQALKEKRDAEIRDVFTGKSDKFSLSSDHVLQINEMPYAIIF